jgi:CheY-like chemotaxis protein
VTSRAGEGTTFRFEIDLPATTLPVAVRHQQRVVAIHPPLPRRRILVADDNDDNRRLLSSLLEIVGFAVREAMNGLEAIELWETWHPELIFMDQRMPKMDGSAATRAIRERESEGGGAQRTAIVALTASVFEHEREMVLASGADDFVMKPFAEETIFEAIAQHLGIRYIREADRKRPRATGRILVVDDSSINRQIASATLEKHGFTVTQAINGVEALQRLDEDAIEYDAVLLDIEMPQLDGRQTVARIRTRERLRDLPVIALTAHDADDIGVIEGMTDFVTKPIEAPQLMAVLARHGVTLTAAP